MLFVQSLPLLVSVASVKNQRHLTVDSAYFELDAEVLVERSVYVYGRFSIVVIEKQRDGGRRRFGESMSSFPDGRLSSEPKTLCSG